MPNERRINQRNAVSYPADVSVPGGGGIRATVVDISRNGLQLACDRHSLLKICPRGHLTSPADRVPLRTVVMGEVAVGSETEVEVQGRVVYVRRLSQTEYRIGLSYASISQESERQLKQWLCQTEGQLVS